MKLDGKMEALNTAIRDALPHMKDAASNNPNAEVLVRVLRFSTGAAWHVGTPVMVQDFQWTDIPAEEGVTELGRAMVMIAEQLKVDKMPQRALPPVLALVTDGLPTDDFVSGLRRLMDEPWAKKAVRVAIGIGDDADMETLQRFIGHNEIRPLRANNPDQLVRYIRWASTAVVGSASQPRNTGLDVPAATPPAVAPPSATTPSAPIPDDDPALTSAFGPPSPPASISTPDPASSTGAGLSSTVHVTPPPAGPENEPEIW
jgi:uncharacterized protein YegL